MSAQANNPECAICKTRLGRRRSITPLGLAHLVCAVKYRRENAGRGDYDSRLPAHLR